LIIFLFNLHIHRNSMRFIHVNSSFLPYPWTNNLSPLSNQLQLKQPLSASVNFCQHRNKARVLAGQSDWLLQPWPLVLSNKDYCFNLVALLSFQHVVLLSNQMPQLKCFNQSKASIMVLANRVFSLFSICHDVIQLKVLIKS